MCIRDSHTTCTLVYYCRYDGIMQVGFPMGFPARVDPSDTSHIAIRHLITTKVYRMVRPPRMRAVQMAMMEPTKANTAAQMELTARPRTCQERRSQWCTLAEVLRKLQPRMAGKRPCLSDLARTPSDLLRRDEIPSDGFMQKGSPIQAGIELRCRF